MLFKFFHKTKDGGTCRHWVAKVGISRLPVPHRLHSKSKVNLGCLKGKNEVSQFSRTIFIFKEIVLLLNFATVKKKEHRAAELKASTEGLAFLQGFDLCMLQLLIYTK